MPYIILSLLINNLNLPVVSLPDSVGADLRPEALGPVMLPIFYSSFSNLGIVLYLVNANEIEDLK